MDGPFGLQILLEILLLVHGIFYITVQSFSKVQSINHRDLELIKNSTRNENINAVFNKNGGSGSLSVKMLLVRIVENDRIDAYFRAG